MLTHGEDVEAHALRQRGWTISGASSSESNKISFQKRLSQQRHRLLLEPAPRAIYTARGTPPAGSGTPVKQFPSFPTGVQRVNRESAGRWGRG
jgi:hypothetical protein